MDGNKDRFAKSSDMHGQLAGAADEGGEQRRERHTDKHGKNETEHDLEGPTKPPSESENRAQ